MVQASAYQPGDYVQVNCMDAAGHRIPGAVVRVRVVHRLGCGCLRLRTNRPGGDGSDCMELFVQDRGRCAYGTCEDSGVEQAPRPTTALPGVRVQWFGPGHGEDTEWSWQLGLCTRRENERAWVRLDSGREITDYAHLLRIQDGDVWYRGGRPIDRAS